MRSSSMSAVAGDAEDVVDDDDDERLR